MGDRAEGPHEASLFDIDAKYGDVIFGNDVVNYVRGLAGSGFSNGTRDAFEAWWNEGQEAPV